MEKCNVKCTEFAESLAFSRVFYNLFAYFKKKYIEKVRGICKEIEEPLSGIEMEAAKRFETLSTTNTNLIKVFENIKEYKEYNWDTFSKDVLK